MTTFYHVWGLALPSELAARAGIEFQRLVKVRGMDITSAQEVVQKVLQADIDAWLLTVGADGADAHTERCALVGTPYRTTARAAIVGEHEPAVDDDKPIIRLRPPVLLFTHAWALAGETIVVDGDERPKPTWVYGAEMPQDMTLGVSANAAFAFHAQHWYWSASA